MVKVIRYPLTVLSWAQRRLATLLERPFGFLRVAKYRDRVRDGRENGRWVDVMGDGRTAVWLPSSKLLRPIEWGWGGNIRNIYAVYH
jgi:hypothetical protein